LPFFFAEREGDHALIRGSDASHLARSLRARPGEEIQVVDAQGLLLTVRVETVSTSLIAGRILAEEEHLPEPTRHVVVGISHLPATSLDLVLSRCTEVGASAFHIVQADRSVSRGARPDRWQTIVREAAMLAGRLRVPVINGPSPLAAVLREEPNPVMLMRGAATRLSALPLEGEVTLLIGPEGGWTEREVAMVLTRASLGPRNLRADTAAVVATAIAVGV